MKLPHSTTIGSKTIVTRQTADKCSPFLVEIWEDSQRKVEYFRFTKEDALRWHDILCRPFVGLALYIDCPNCSKLRRLVFDGSARYQLCPHCNADAEGKVYPKKRETPKIIEKLTLQANEELDNIIAKVLAENQKAVDDYKGGNKAAINRLVGMTKKQLPLMNANEIKQRIEQKI